MNMKKNQVRIGLLLALTLVFSGLLPTRSQAQEEKGVHSITSEEPITHLKEFQRRLDWTASRINQVQVDPDAVGDSKVGAISLQQHAEEIAGARNEFTLCLAKMKASIATKEASGTATDADKAQFKKCVAHCESILEKLNSMHMNATMLGSANHKDQWVVDGLEKHKKVVAEVQALAAECPDMVHKTMECCTVKKGDAASAKAESPKGVHSISAEEPITHLKEFQRRLDWTASRMNQVQVDPDAVGDSKVGAISLKQHAEEIAGARSEFTLCLAKMKASIASKEASGTATDADKAQFKKSVAHCESILEKLNSMHMNATVLGSANHKDQWVVDGLEKHKKVVAEVQALAADCSDLVHKTMECCKSK